MSRKLLIVESKNKVETLKSFLPNDYVVAACNGHIADITEGGDYWNTGIDVANGFAVKYVVPKENEGTVKYLKEQARLADEVIIASDPDREGEAIAWSLKEILKIPEKKYKRVTFHEITQSAVTKALANPRKIDYALVYAAHGRRKLDRMIGYRYSNASRKFVDCPSVGRTQSAGLELIANREAEINNFVPKAYGELNLCFTYEGKDYKAKYFGDNGKEVKQPSVEHCESVINDCQGNLIKFTDIYTKDKKSNPKPPFITSTFQQEVSNKLGIDTDKAQDYAQKLFEGININGKHVALITYIRTDSTELAEEFVPILKEHVIDSYGKNYYAPVKKGKKGSNVQDGHEAIRPVDLTMTPEKLSNILTDKNLVKVYEIIYKRTVASSMAPEITSETTCVITCNGHDFHLVSRQQKFDGYKKVYTYKEKEEEELKTCPFEKGWVMNKKENPSFELIEKQTTPPSRFKDSAFVGELESSGIGRPSTYTTIVKILKDAKRGYCEVKDGYLVPTEKGIRLANWLQDNHLVNIEDTSEMEKKLDLIAKGELKEVDFLKEILDKIEKSMEQFTPKKQAPQLTDIKCPECGAPMILRESKYGKFYGCSKFPKCKGIVK